MLEFIRGDTLPFKFQIKYADETIVTKDDINTLKLTCRKSNTLSSPILFKKSINDFTYEDDYYHCAFEPEDTEELSYGTYNFDIEITLVSGYKKTLKSQFKITEEDTIYEKSEE